MNKKAESAVRKDAPRNLIQIRHLGHVTALEMEACIETVKKLIPGMRAGFTLLTDLSGLDSMELECAGVLGRIMDACKAGGIGTAVRIIPDPRKDIGFNILAQIHYRSGVHVITCRNASEAKLALKPGRRL
jgi:uncharacterized 2Fe-2S/4Fe-4S cluster protein (DUF4445 family)